MRALIIIAGFGLALGACGKNDQSADTQNTDQTMTADSIVSNDVTAIDAVTGDAANMAADVNYQDFDNSVADLGSGGNGSSTGSVRPRPAKRPATSAKAPAATTNTASSAAPATNATANVTD